MKFNNSKRIELLKEQVKRTMQHIASVGAYLTSEQRVIIATEARNCLGFASSSQLEANPDADTKLPNELKADVHKIMNFQSKCTADWYKDSLVPHAASYARVQALVDQEGAAMECIGVCAITAALTILQLGIYESAEFPVISTEEETGPKLSLRAMSYSEKITRNSATGWAPFVMKKDLRFRKTDGYGKIINRAVETAGERFFLEKVPFKSLSVGLGDYVHAFELAATLYVPMKEIANFSRISPGGLNRVQVETIAAAYTESRKCDF